MKNLRIVFMGTPEIAAESLRQIILHNYNVVGVVTTPDKPAGRGLKITESSVKQCAKEHQLHILQPENLSSPEFLNEIKQLEPDLIIVVAFRKIPDSVIQLARQGAFNLHASLLPQYRGAAPINWALINGESKSGLTTFFLNNQIDTGDMLLQEIIDIPANWNASRLYQEMQTKGSILVIKTIDGIINHSLQPISQTGLVDDAIPLKKAPKIFKEHCRIDWSKGVLDIQNLIRGLSYKPGAFTEFIDPTGDVYPFKILVSAFEKLPSVNKIGSIETDNKKYLHVFCSDGIIDIKELQLSGKKLMSVDEFLRGFKINNHWLVR